MTKPKDLDVDGEEQVYAEDMLCDWCDRWCTPVVHDHDDYVYCIDCVEEAAFFFIEQKDGRLIEGDTVILKVISGSVLIDRVLEAIQRNRIFAEEREYDKKRFKKRKKDAGDVI